MTTITAEILTDLGPDQIGITVEDLESGDQIISIEVSWDAGNTWHAVVGGTMLSAVGGAFVRDHYPPLNMPTIWRVIEHSVSGSPATVTDPPITVESTSSYLQDPLNPRDYVSLVAECPPGSDTTLMWGTTAHAAWRQEVEFVGVLGADRPVAATGQRWIAGNVPLNLSHEVAQEGGKLRRLLLSTGILILRMAKPTMLEPVAHITVGDADEDILYIRDSYQVSTWALSATQVRPMSLLFAIPWWTYQQVDALWEGFTYDEVEGARPGDTYLDWQKDPTP